MSDVLFIECKICHKQCKNYTSLGTHIVRAHPTITLADYYKTYLKTNENEGKCLICGKDTAFKRLSIGFHKYCSCICMGKDDTVIEKRKQTCLTRYGVDSSGKLPQSLGAGLKAYYEKTEKILFHNIKNIKTYYILFSEYYLPLIFTVYMWEG